MFGNLTNFTTILNEFNATNIDFFTTTDAGLYTSTEQPTQRDLIWMLPAFLGIICFLIGIACALFYTITQCEMCILRLLYKHCGCCEPPPGKEGRQRQSYSELKERDDIQDEIDAMYMKDFVSNSTFGTIEDADDTDRAQ